MSSGQQVTGLVIMPASDRFTRSTWGAWSSIERLRCSTPMPPWRAIAIAIRASVTVSIALDTSGMAQRDPLRVSRVAVSTSLGTTSDSAGQQQHVVEGQAERQTVGRAGPSASDAIRCRHGEDPTAGDVRSSGLVVHRA